MALQVGDEILDGQVIIIGVQDDLVTQIEFPNITDVFGRPLTITFNPGQALANVEAIAALILAQNS